MTTCNWHFEHSVECDATLSAAWAFWTEVDNWERIEGDAVECIELDGPFQEGIHGRTKVPGQPAMSWRIAEVDFERSATIEMPVDGALFCNRMAFESLVEARTRVTQRMWLEGDIQPELLAGVKTFEETAPQGLAKLATAIGEASRSQNTR